MNEPDLTIKVLRDVIDGLDDDVVVRISRMDMDGYVVYSGVTSVTVARNASGEVTLLSLDSD